MRKNLRVICAMTVATLVVSGCANTTVNTQKKPIETETVVDVEETITFSNDGIKSNGDKVTIDNNTATITTGGEYIITGDTNNGRLIVESDEDVDIILDNVNITYKDGDAIYIKNGDVTFTLAEDSVNNIVSGDESTEKLEDLDEDEKDESTETAAEESTEDDKSSDEEALDSTTEEEESPEKEERNSKSAAIFSKDDIIFEGSGTINITSYFNNGIHAKDTVTINSGDITITSVNDGIKGKKGVVVAGGNINIQSDGDGIQSNEDLDIAEGEIDIVAGGGSENATNNQSDDMSNMPDMEGTERPTGEMQSMPDMEGMERPTGEMQDMPDMEGMERPTSEMQDMPDKDASEDIQSDDEDSAKGIKAKGILSISGGILNIDSSDDTLHSNDKIGIDGGEFILKSGDDGIHADNTLLINAGSIDIQKCVEGLEAVSIEINNGTLNIVSSDDGVNASGGNSSFDIKEMHPFGDKTNVSEDDEKPVVDNAKEDNEEAANEENISSEDTDVDDSLSEAEEVIEPVLTINGGTIYINAEGDGLDSNKDLIINGGDITVVGPSNGGNSAIDYGSESGGIASINGGKVIATGYSEMAEMFDSENSKQCSLVYVFENTVAVGTQIIITNSNGEEILNYTAEKACDCVTYSSELLKKDETYTVTASSETGELLQSDTSVANKELTGFGGGEFFGGEHFGEKNDENGFNGFRDKEGNGREGFFGRERETETENQNAV